MSVSPKTLTVLRGEEARFTCSTSYDHWTVIVWLLNGDAVLTISKAEGVLASVFPNVTAEESPHSKRRSWVFILNNTERHNQGSVTCDIQGIDRRTASLFVQGLYVRMQFYIGVWEWLRGDTLFICVLPWFTLAGRQPGSVYFCCREFQRLFL